MTSFQQFKQDLRGHTLHIRACWGRMPWETFHIIDWDREGLYYRRKNDLEIEQSSQVLNLSFKTLNLWFKQDAIGLVVSLATCNNQM